MILPITAYGSPILRQKCVEVDNTEANYQHIQNLIDTHFELRRSALALAMPQIGILLRAFVITMQGKQQIIINPIIRKRRGTQLSNERCMSIPGVHIDVIGRSNIIDVEFYDEHFKKHRRKLNAFESVIFQHEFDHLNGILITDHTTKEGLEEIADQLATIEEGKILVHYDMSFKSGEILTPQPKPQPIAVTTDSFSNPSYIYTKSH